jgi:hypothetical protein
MPSGSRPGERRGGRKKGTPNKRPGGEIRKTVEEMRQLMAPTPGAHTESAVVAGAPNDPYYANVETPLELALLVLTDSRLDLGIRMVAMKEAFPYIHSRVATQPYKPPDHDGRIFVELVKFSEDDFK